MENGGGGENAWNFRPKTGLVSAGFVTIRGALDSVESQLDENDPRSMLPLGHGDPSPFTCFRTATVAEDAVVAAVNSGRYNSYASNLGIVPARKAVAEYLSRDLPYKLCSDDVYMTLGCTQAIEVALSVIARPQANILLPRPGFPYYEARCAYTGIEARHFDLLPDSNWEVDLQAVEGLADDNTVAMVVINPGNPCGSVFSYEHMAKIAETAKRLGILVIADEVYAHLAFGKNPFTPMGIFGSIVPVLTLGSISKRWIVPGWRMGWLVTTDPKGVLKKTKVVDSIQSILNISCDPATFIQGAIPKILNETKDEFFENIITILRQAADTCYDKLKEIDCLLCPYKPEGSMFAMAKLNLSLLEDITDDFDFCCKLAKEEKMVILPGTAVGLKGWLRITFAIDLASLADGLCRLKSFCDRHKKQ